MQRLKCAELEQKLEEMKLEIQKSSVEVDHQLSQDITSILGKADKNVTPFMNLFCFSLILCFCIISFAKEYERTLTYTCMMLCKTSLATLLLIISSELDNIELYAEITSTS